jgi:hypothetical protein
MIQSREEIAKRYGCETFAELLDLSNPLPMLPGDTARTYIARRPGGTWFVWLDPLEQHPRNGPHVLATDGYRSVPSQSLHPTGRTSKGNGV